MKLIPTIIQLLTPAFIESSEVKMPFILPPEYIKQEQRIASNGYSALASWYGPGFHGRQTASGEIFNQNDLTAAHPYLPFGTLLRVSYRGNSVVVRVNDRGPFTGGRDLDISAEAAYQLGLTDAGVDYVTVSHL